MDYLLLSVVVAVTVVASVISCCLIASLCMYRFGKHADDPEASQDPMPSEKMKTDDCKFSSVQEKSFYSLIGTPDGTNSSETSSQCESTEYEKESVECSEFEIESVESSEYERESVEPSEYERSFTQQKSMNSTRNSFNNNNALSCSNPSRRSVIMTDISE